VLLTGTVVALMFTALGIWLVGNRRQRVREERRRVWEPLVLGVVCDDDEVDQLRAELRIAAVIPAKERQAFGEFVLGYLHDLRGDDAARLRRLLVALGYEEESIRRLRSRNPWQRALSARLLGELRAPAAETALVECLGDRNLAVSLSAASALLKTGTTSGLAAVAASLVQRDDWSESQIKELLPEGGAALADHLLRLLEKGDVRETRLKILVELMGLLRHLPSVDRLLEILGSNPPMEVRVSALRSLGRMEVPEVLPHALAGLRDSSWIVRSQSVMALGRAGSPEAIPDLVRALSDHHYWVRFNAAVALRELGEPGRQALTEFADGESDLRVLADEVLLEEQLT